MKNAIVWTVVLVLSVSSLVASPIKISDTRIVQAKKDTTLTYAGVKIFVPVDQVIILGTHPDGSVGVRGQDIQSVKVGSGTFTSRGEVAFVFHPKEQIVFVQKGELMVTDGKGYTDQFSAGVFVSVQDIRSTVIPTLGEKEITTAGKPMKKGSFAKSEEAQDAAQDMLGVPFFVASTATSSAASEQAAQDAEDTISPSAPR